MTSFSASDQTSLFEMGVGFGMIQLLSLWDGVGYRRAGCVRDLPVWVFACRTTMAFVVLVEFGNASRYSDMAVCVVGDAASITAISSADQGSRSCIIGESGGVGDDVGWVAHMAIFAFSMMA